MGDVNVNNAKHIIAELINNDADDKINYAKVVELLFEINQDIINTYQKTAIVTLLSRKLNEKIPYQVLSCLANKFFESSNKINLLKDNRTTIDVCGTGGDGVGTINISSAVALLLSFSDDFAVVKHGNIAVSSKSGSADIFKLLGFDFSIDKQYEYIKRYNIAFLLAPLYNNAFVNFAEIRKNLGIKTIFNFIGPLINPASPDIQIIGISSQDVLGYAKACLLSNHKNFAIVSSLDGLDEISAIAPTKILYCFDGVLSEEITISPLDFGVREQYSMNQILGKDSNYNFQKIKDLFDVKNNQSQDIKCLRDFVLINAAMCFYLKNNKDNLKTCYQKAMDIYEKICNNNLFFNIKD